MAYTPEQAEQIKQQIFSQIETSHLPNKEEIKQQIQQMNESELEEFVKQQQAQSSQSSEQGSQCIFCSINNQEIPSKKIAENKKAIAILEINPLSKGHVIILPKEHIPTDKLPSSALGLAKKVTAKIKSKLNPEDIKIETSSLQGHAMINVIPIYKEQKLEKKQASEEELKELFEELEIKKRGPRITKPKTEKITSKSRIIKIPFRIP